MGLGVSCSADRNAKGRIDKHGIWLEKLETNPGRFLPAEGMLEKPKEPVAIDLNRPMEEILKALSVHPVATPLSLTGTIVVARDMAHAKLMERLIAGKVCRNILKTTRYTMPVQQRRPKEKRRVHLVRRQRAEWMLM